MIQRLRGPLEILIWISNRKFCLEVSSSDTVSSVKLKIQQHWETPKNLQRLIFNNKELDDHSTLSDCGIQDGSTVPMVRRLSAAVA